VKDGVVTKYISAADMKVAQVKGTEVSYYHKDHLNSSTVMTNNSGTKVEETAYAPYGTMRSFTGTAVTNYRYTGKEIDPETNLYYYGARYYDPMMGRFITADSIVSDVYDPQDLNRYAYCRNNPMKYVDPDGHAADTVWDLINIGMGIASFAYNVKTGNVSGAIVDALGIVGDSAAAAIPFIPGGFGTGIKAYRAADTAADALKAARTGSAAVEQTAKAGSKVAVGGAAVAERAVTLSPAQQNNINRFTNKVPANAKDNIQTHGLPNEGVAVQATSPGKVTGSKAVYEKQIDATGKTTQYTKTTYDPEGNIVHIKDKIGGGIYYPE
jgi:RHS repeat-associated protein